jgi:hypothetical protein
MDQDIFPFDSRCPECKEDKPVQSSKTELKSALADNRNIRVGSSLCGHTWDIPRSERENLRSMLPELSG